MPDFTKIKKPKNNQDVFNRAWKWLVVDKNKKCSNSQGTCMYRKVTRAGEIRNCVIGAMLPDKLLKEFPTELQSTSIVNVIDKNSEVGEWFKNINIYLLAEFQEAHDEIPMKDRHKYMAHIADVYKLKIPNDKAKK